jgi:methylmalonyl-CoA mutase N-terminal domain/subunit
MAAVLGGAQSLHTNSKDEALALPSEAAAKLALRTQQIIAHETGIADVVDPLGGSYTLERLTDELEARADAYLGKDRHPRRNGGGHRPGLSTAGDPGRGLPCAARAGDPRVGRWWVSTNFARTDRRRRACSASTSGGGGHRPRDWKRSGRTRDGASVQRRLDALRTAAKDERQNLVPLILDAVKSLATLGEISDAMRDVFGEHREQVVL